MANSKTPQVQGSPMTLSKKVRPLPIHNKEEVFNEWGAILRHQDEIDQTVQKQNLEKMKLRQQSYKLELDKQYRELQANKKGYMSQNARKEEDLVHFQQRQVEQRQLKEDVNKKRLQEN